MPTSKVTLKHMEEYLDILDTLHDEGKVTIGEYIQIGVNLKMTQILLEIQRSMKVIDN